MVALGPRVTRLRAPNPSAMTLDGTNGYVVDGGAGRWIAIDPGPDDAGHIAAFVTSAHDRDARFEAILVTHGHPDHYPGAAPLARATGAPVYAHRKARFPHDRELADGDDLRVGDAVLRVMEVPGHAVDHLAFRLTGERALFTGDTIIGTGTVVVAPPGGEMRTYQRTLARLRAEWGDAAVIYGGHGPERTDVVALMDFYLRHREQREAQLLAELAHGEAAIPELVMTLYAAVDRRLWRAAARQMLAYLIALEREGRVRSRPAGRPATDAERAILDPDLRALAPEARDVVRAEFGYAGADADVRLFSLK